jgi:two-component system chemotaxis sensor kinase CheA
MHTRVDVSQKGSCEDALDDLALQVVLNGVGTFSRERLCTLAQMAESDDYPALAKEARSVAASIDLTSVDEREIQQVICTLRALIPAPSPQDLDTKTPCVIPELSTLSSFENDPEMLAGFVLETGEHLLAIEENILLLEREPLLIERIHAVFRGFHSIKGLAGFLGLTRIQSVAHEVETLLDHARNLRIGITSELVDLVLESSKYVGNEVALVEARLNNTLPPPIQESRQLLRQLRLVAASVPPDRSNQGSHDTDDVNAMPTPLMSMGAHDLLTNPFIESPEATVAAVQPSSSVLRTSPSVIAEDFRSVGRGEVAGASVRVETSKLDRLMDMVGEMVIAQTMLKNNPRLGGRDDARIGAEMSQLARVTSEVQRCAMSMRLTPIGPLFRKSAKIVRDLSRRNGKQVLLELSGENTELDKMIAEELSDPLLHMVRNALDHGIETIEERIIAGKNPVACLRIGAIHKGGQITIFISDDGRGLNSERILTKAVERGLVDEHAQLDEVEIFHLIFAPGFSTAEEITDISGRGVGMDVVKKHVQKLRGRIEIKSVPGNGTTFLIHLPLTLAIIEGLVVLVGSQKYIIPIFVIQELFRPAEEMLFTLQGVHEMILVHDDLLPMVRLHECFSIPKQAEGISSGLVVVCEVRDSRFCLFVDDLVGRQEIVIKSLDETFKQTKGLAGSAILGDGKIGLILDVEGIFHFTQKDKAASAA